MCTPGMGLSLHKVKMWLRRLYPKKGTATSSSHAEAKDIGITRKQVSTDSSEAEVEHHSHHTHDRSRSRSAKEHTCHSYAASIPRIGVPVSEEYDKMVSGMPYRPACLKLRAKKVEARQFCAKYNVDDEVFQDPTLPSHELWAEWRKEREKMLRTIIGSVGQAPLIDPPFNFSYGCNIVFGDSLYANVNLRIVDSGFVTIGNRVFIGPNVTIVTDLHDKEIQSRRDGIVYTRPVAIGDDCWIAVGVTILPGVTIGKGCVIGAGSVVTRDIPPFSVAWGQPARVVEDVKDAHAVYATVC